MRLATGALVNTTIVVERRPAIDLAISYDAVGIADAEVPFEETARNALAGYYGIPPHNIEVSRSASPRVPPAARRRAQQDGEGGGTLQIRIAADSEAELTLLTGQIVGQDGGLAAADDVAEVLDVGNVSLTGVNNATLLVDVVQVQSMDWCDEGMPLYHALTPKCCAPVL